MVDDQGRLTEGAHRTEEDVIGLVRTVQVVRGRIQGKLVIIFFYFLFKKNNKLLCF